MRRFLVFLDKNLAGSEPSEETLEFDDDTPEEEIELACQECLDTMIGNEIHTGWEEIP
jgi:hypothetical protein